MSSSTSDLVPGGGRAAASDVFAPAKPYVEFGLQRDPTWPTLTVNIPTRRDLVAQTVINLLQSLFCDVEYNVHLRFMIGKSNIDQARSILATYWYDEQETNPNRDPRDAFMFLDSDQTFTPDDLKRLLRTEGDVVCGVYANNLGSMTCRPVDFNQLANLGEGELEAGATGFMLFRFPILDKVAELLGRKRYLVASMFKTVIPFFSQTFTTSDIFGQQVDDWLGEDYGFCHKVRQVGGVVRGFISPTLGHVLSGVRTLPLPTFQQALPSRYITVLAPGPPWSPSDQDLGGSELAIRELAQRWATMNFRVLVYAGVKEPVNLGEVIFLPYQQIQSDVLHNILVCWRYGAVYALDKVHARRVIADFHDCFVDRPMVYGNVINRYMVKSEFHRRQLLPLLDPLLHNLVKVVPNGLEREFIDHPLNTALAARAPDKVLYASSYVRGLTTLIREVMPLIWDRGHRVEVHIYYGRALLTEQQNREFDALFNHPLVKEHGRVSRRELFRLRESFRVHCYPDCDFETDCLSVKESILAGCVPVVSKNCVFATDERQYAQRIERGDHRAMAEEVLKLLHDDQYFREVQRRLHQRAKEQVLDWDQVAKLWDNELI